jgi:hypothetical protein
MEITTSWMEQGIDRGIEQGIDRGASREKEFIIRQIDRQLGVIDAELKERIRNLSLDRAETLGFALFDFISVSDLVEWLGREGER